MKVLIKKSLITFSPFLIFLVFIFYWDPFKIYWDYDNYYQNNRIGSNREYICLQLFKKKMKTTELNSFIIGSSRSQVFNASIWKNLLGDQKDEVRPFHFDASGLGLFRARNIIKYIDKKVKKIDHVLLLVDNEFLSELNYPEGLLYIEPPEIAGQSIFHYQLTFIKACFDPYFLYYNLVYNTTNRYSENMFKYIDRIEYPYQSNNETADLYYSANTAIKIDSINYYKKMFERKAFYERSPTEIVSEVIMKDYNRKLINEIADIFKKHQTKVKVIVSPLYTQIKINPADLQFLIDTFGEQNVTDFSGINDITNNIANYYESYHYKYYVATEIMQRVYQPKKR
jgi:hypothetical protein